MVFGNSSDDINRRNTHGKCFIYEVIYFHAFLVFEGHIWNSVGARDVWVNKVKSWNSDMDPQQS